MQWCWASWPRSARPSWHRRRRGQRRCGPRSHRATDHWIGWPSAPSGPVRRRAVWTTSPSSKATPRPSTSAPPPAGSTRRRTTARPSPRCSITRAVPRWATSRLRRPTPISSGSAPARTTTGRAARGATASTSRPTVAVPGRTWGSAPASRSPASSSTPSTSTSSTWRHLATCGRRAASAVSTRRRMAARTGSGCCTWTTTPAPPNW